MCHFWPPRIRVPRGPPGPPGAGAGGAPGGPGEASGDPPPGGSPGGASRGPVPEPPAGGGGGTGRQELYPPRWGVAEERPPCDDPVGIPISTRLGERLHGYAPSPNSRGDRRGGTNGYQSRPLSVDVWRRSRCGQRTRHHSRARTGLDIRRMWTGAPRSVAKGGRENIRRGYPPGGGRSGTPPGGVPRGAPEGGFWGSKRGSKKGHFWP